MRWRDMKPRDRSAERWELWVKPQAKGGRWTYVTTGLLRTCLDEADKYPKHDFSFRDVTDQPKPPEMNGA